MKENKLKILIYSEYFWPSVGGSENYALDLATELSREGHCVGVITASKSSGEDNFPFKLYRLHKPLSPKGLNINFLEIPTIINNFEPDIFHINYQSGGENFLIVLLWLMRIPVVLTYHADHVLPIGKLIDEAQILSTFKLLDKVLVQTNRDKVKFNSKGIKSSKIILFRFSGIDTRKYNCKSSKIQRSERVRGICIARMDDSHNYKGINRLIEMINSERFLFSTGQISLAFVGDGNLKKEYENKVKDFHLEGVEFLGKLSDDILIQELCKSDFLILPSTEKAEGFGRVALEAMSCGILTAVSQFAGISEILTKYNSAIIFDPFSNEEVFRKIHLTLNNYKQRDNIINNAYAMIRKEGLDIRDTVQKTVDIYRQTLAQRYR
ncbi:MAG: glycosyltransferase family 4 protein [Conexivisphaerales archaeon]